MNESDLDVERFFIPSVRPGDGDALRAAAKRYRDMQVPASEAQRVAALRELRIGTMPQRLSDREASAIFAKLVKDLDDLPDDVLRSACFTYANMPGTRFFPRSPGELREFTTPAVVQRNRRAARLEQMAKACDEAWVKPEDDRIHPRDVVADNLMMKRIGAKTRYHPDGTSFQLKPGDVDPVPAPIEEPAA